MYVDVENRSSQMLWVAIGGAAPIVVAAALVALRDHLLNANVALVLVLVVVLAAVGGGRIAGAAAAVSAALSFNFFHTVPYLTLEIDSADDVETTLLLLAVGLAVGQLASYRRHPKRVGESPSDEIRRIHRVAAFGEARRHTSADMIMAAQLELTELLELRSCQFEAFPFTHPLPRLERSGVISVMEYHGPDHGFAFPAGGVELPVLGRGNVLGRFVLIPEPSTSVTLEQRVVAVAIADQVGAALADPDRHHANRQETADRPARPGNETKGISHG
jgi:Domain of unknown function (DUF4118)